MKNKKSYLFNQIRLAIIASYLVCFTFAAKADCVESLNKNESPDAMHLIYQSWNNECHEIEVMTHNDLLLMVVIVHDANTKKILHRYVNSSLFPLFEPYTNARVKLLSLDPEISGFSVSLSYSYFDGTDRFVASFTHNGSPKISSLRKERINSSGQVESGILVDYKQMKGRWLGNATQGARSALPPFVMKKGVQVGFESLRSIYDFPPEGDFPVKYR